MNAVDSFQPVDHINRATSARQSRAERFVSTSGPHHPLCFAVCGCCPVRRSSRRAWASPRLQKDNQTPLPTLILVLLAALGIGGRASLDDRSRTLSTRTSNCSFCHTRSPCCGALTRDPAWTGRTGVILAAFVRRLPTWLRGLPPGHASHHPALASPTLVPKRWTYPNRPGRQAVNDTVAALVVRMATRTRARDTEECKASCSNSGTASAHLRHRGRGGGPE
jgi:hypothetical protein